MRLTNKNIQSKFSFVLFLSIFLMNFFCIVFIANAQLDAIGLPGDVGEPITNETLVDGDRCCLGQLPGDPVTCLYSIKATDSCNAGDTLIPKGCIDLVNTKIQPACSATNVKPTKPVTTPAPQTTDIVKDLKISKPILEINLPQLKFTDVSNTLYVAEDGTGYFYFPYIGEYMSAVYKIGMMVVSIIGVIMIIVVGVKITVLGGEERVAGFKKIGQVIIGLFIAWGSYGILYNINPDLVNFKALKVEYIQRQELAADYDAASSAGSRELSNIKGVIPQLVNGVYSAGMTVPAASTCSNVCMKTKGGERCVDQKKRDMAYEAQLKTGYPAAVMLAQYMIEGPTFGLTCSGKFTPSIPGDAAAIEAVGCNPEKCGPGFTWECTNKEKYKPPKAPQDFKDGNPNGNQTKDCGKGDKANSGYVAVHGYRCFRKPVSEGNIFAPLIDFYESHKCFKQKKDSIGGTPEAFALAVQACGYATAQTYGDALINKMNAYCLVGAKTTVPNVSPDISEVKTE